MISVSPLVHEKVWLDKPKYDAAERRYYERLAKSSESAKDNNSLNETDIQENASLVKVPDIENIQENQTSPSKLCSKPDQKNTNKGRKGDSVKEDDKCKGAEMEVCSIKQNSPKVEENVCPKLPTDFTDNVCKLLPELCVPPPRICVYPLKTVVLKKDKENDLCTLPQNKEDICSKSEKTKKSDFYNKENSTSKVENMHKKSDTCDVTCSKVKSHNKSKVADEMISKPEFTSDKGNAGIDPVSEVVKGVSQNSNSWNSLAGEVAKARQHIRNSLNCIDDIAVTSNIVSVEITNRLNTLEKENVDLKNQVSELVELLKKMDLRISSMEKCSAGGSKSTDVKKASAPAPQPKKDDAEDDDGVDLFGSDSEEEDTEAAKIKEQRLAEYAARKAKKPVLIAKSNIILDVKPWDDETNMKELEAEVRKITTDGLVWGASKLVPLAYGIHKLQISCVVEDDKVSVDWLQETIQEVEDYVQSVDIAAFNKV